MKEVAFLNFSIGTSGASDRRRWRETAARERACQSAHSSLIFKCGNPHASLNGIQEKGRIVLQASRWKLHLQGQDQAQVSHQEIAWNVTWREIGAANWIKCDFTLWQPWFFGSLLYNLSQSPPGERRQSRHIWRFAVCHLLSNLQCISYLIPWRLQDMKKHFKP